MKLYQELASLIIAIKNCETTNNNEWLNRHRDRLAKLVKDKLPSGGGFNSGTELDSKSTRNKLIFHTAYHHMDGAGGYDGWTDHSVIVTPSLFDEIDLRITGRNRNDIKEYISAAFIDALTQEIPREV